MDPEENWEEQLALATRINDDRDWVKDDARRLSELVLSLAEWVKKGGFPPAVFQRDASSKQG